MINKVIILFTMLYSFTFGMDFLGQLLSVNDFNSVKYIDNNGSVRIKNSHRIKFSELALEQLENNSHLTSLLVYKDESFVVIRSLLEDKELINKKYGKFIGRLYYKLNTENFGAIETAQRVKILLETSKGTVGEVIIKSSRAELNKRIRTTNLSGRLKYGKLESLYEKDGIYYILPYNGELEGE